jgi:hypothetical protein
MLQAGDVTTLRRLFAPGPPSWAILMSEGDFSSLGKQFSTLRIADHLSGTPPDCSSVFR